MQGSERKITSLTIVDQPDEDVRELLDVVARKQRVSVPYDNRRGKWSCMMHMLWGQITEDDFIRWGDLIVEKRADRNNRVSELSDVDEEEGEAEEQEAEEEEAKDEEDEEEEEV